MLKDQVTSNQTHQRTVGFRVLSEAQIKKIHRASLEVLERTGVEIRLQETRDLLQEGGCRVEGNTVYFPPHLVEWAIGAAPKQALIYDRLGNKCMSLGGYNTYFGLGPTVLNIIDPEDGQRRKFVKEDTEKAARLVDALPNIDWVMGLGTISDLPYEHSDRHEFEAMVKNTTKPIVVWSYTNEGLKDIVNMASAVTGGQDKLVEKPFIVSYSEPISPLINDKDASAKLLLAAEYNIPTIHTPIPQSGASAPVTLAGQLVMGNAENLAALVISQLKNEGVPFFVGGVFSIMDMSKAILAYGAPEMDLALAAYMDIAHHYNLPTWGTAGCTDSKIMDEQTAIEASMSSLFSALSGANLVHDVGYMESANTGSLELIVVVDEIVGMIKRFVEGIEVNEETLAVEVVREVGHGGTYITHQHTLDHYREMWDPTLMERRVRSKWKDDGSKRMSQRATEKVQKILSEHKPEPLSEEAEQQIEQILSDL